jgi:hypothetical protein
MYPLLIFSIIISLILINLRLFERKIFIKHTFKKKMYKKNLLFFFNNLKIKYNYSIFYYFHLNFSHQKYEFYRSRS